MALNQRDAAVYRGPIFTGPVLEDSRALFRTLRDLGDAVWIPDLSLYIVARYADVVAALRAPDILISGEGVSVNAEQNAAAGMFTSTILSDGERHRHFKRIVTRPLTPTAMAALKEHTDSLARERVAMLADGQSFDAIAQIANYLPLMIVAQMLGIRGVDSERMLAWSSSAFDAFGPSDCQQVANSAERLHDFGLFMQGLNRDDLVPGGWADALFTAADAGEISLDEARGLLGDYLIPSLDTTIYAIGEMLNGLATTPGAWDKVRANPGLIAGTIDEAVRLATPLRGFTRLAVADFQLSETLIPAGSRVWLMYGAANRDERKYPEPDRFDVERNPRDHLGWGHGVHLCLGKALARLEMEAILRALVDHVGCIEREDARRVINNSAQGFSELVMRMQAI
jgi:cytochrome P450